MSKFFDNFKPKKDRENEKQNDLMIQEDVSLIDDEEDNNQEEIQEEIYIEVKYENEDEEPQDEIEQDENELDCKDEEEIFKEEIKDEDNEESIFEEEIYSEEKEEDVLDIQMSLYESENEINESKIEKEDIKLMELSKPIQNITPQEQFRISKDRTTQALIDSGEVQPYMKFNKFSEIEIVTENVRLTREIDNPYGNGKIEVDVEVERQILVTGARYTIALYLDSRKEIFDGKEEFLVTYTRLPYEFGKINDIKPEELIFRVKDDKKFEVEQIHSEESSKYFMFLIHENEVEVVYNPNKLLDEEL